MREAVPLLLSLALPLFYSGTASSTNNADTLELKLKPTQQALIAAADDFLNPLCERLKDVSAIDADSLATVIPGQLPEDLSLAFGQTLQTTASIQPDESPSVTRSPITRSGANASAAAIGLRYLWQMPQVLTDAEGISLSVIGTAGLQSLVLRVGIDRAQLLIRLSGNCAAIERKAMIYADDDLSGPLAMVELTADGTLRATPEWLNPPVPELPPTEKPLVPANDVAPLKVALVDSGVNYLLPQINKRLARNEQAHIIGYDFWDNDERPFDAHPASGPFRVQRHGTRTAGLFLQEAPDALLVPYRYPRGNMHRMSELLQHIDQLGIVLVGMPLGGNRAVDWEVFEREAKRFPHMLFVVSAGNNGRDIDQQPVYPAALALPNMLVVTSADGSARPAEGSNWGRQHVDYLLPAENLLLDDFNGEKTYASGSSYAVSRMLALLARLLESHRDWSATELIAEVRRRFADGASARYVSGGYIGDPLSVGQVQPLMKLLQATELQAPKFSTDAATATPVKTMRPEIIVLGTGLSPLSVQPMVNELARALSLCNIALEPVPVKHYQVLPHLAEMGIGTSRTLRNQLAPRTPTIYLVDETRILRDAAGEMFRFDAEAFGRGNTRSRSWLRDTVWVKHDVRDAPLAVAHEMMHVLMNSGEHTSLAGNLMNANTSENNRSLTDAQCEQALAAGVSHGLLH